MVLDVVPLVIFAFVAYDFGILSQKSLPTNIKELFPFVKLSF